MFRQAVPIERLRSSTASPRQRSSSRLGGATTTPSGRTHRSDTNHRPRRPLSGLHRHGDRHHHPPRQWRENRSCIKTETGPPHGVRPVERAIRPQAITRKNSLFAGSDGGGRTWATIATLLQTAKMNNIDPLAWLAQTLERMANGWPSSEIDALMPWNYAA